MQREMSNKIRLGKTLNPLNDIFVVSSVNHTSNLKDVFRKFDKLGNFWDRGQADPKGKFQV